MRKLNSKQLRELTDTTLMKNKNIYRYPVYFILDNIYDTYNIGGLFRLADALAINKIFICGQSEIPPNHKIVKASIGTYKLVPWQYFDSTKKAIEYIKIQNKQIKIIAVEQSSKSINYQACQYQLPLALVVGNETNGISDEVLELCDVVVEIPMYGINISLNVIVSTAIISYYIYHKLKI